MLGCVSKPGTSFIRIFEYCVKDSKILQTDFHLISILSKVANFTSVLNFFKASLAEVNLLDLNRFTPFLRFPSVCVYSVFKFYSVTELLCLSFGYRPRFSVQSSEYLIRVGLHADIARLKSAGFKVLKQRCFNARGFRVLAYYYYLKFLQTRLTDIICDNYELSTEFVRVKAFLRRRNSYSLCSGDCGFYSILNLLQQYANAVAYRKLIILPGVSSFQYLNILLGSLLSSSCNLMSFSSIFDWIDLKRFVKRCANCGETHIIYNPRSSYRQRLLTYTVNNNIVLSSYSTVSLGERLYTYLECVSTNFLHNVYLLAFNMLTTAFICFKLMLLVRHNSVLICVS